MKIHWRALVPKRYFVAARLKRSNAIRIKARNFDLLPPALRRSIIAFHEASSLSPASSAGSSPTSSHAMAGSDRSNDDTDHDNHDDDEHGDNLSSLCSLRGAEEPAGLMQEIKRGAKLAPAGSRARGTPASLAKSEPSLPELLERALTKRKLVMQQSDDDQSGVSSIESSQDDLVESLLIKPANQNHRN